MLAIINEVFIFFIYDFTFQVVELISLSRSFYNEIAIHKELQVLVEHHDSLLVL